MISLFHAALLGGSKVTAAECCSNFSSFSECLDGIMDCRWRNPYISYKLTLRNFVGLFADPHFTLAYEGLRLSGMLLLYPVMVHTCFQLTSSPMEHSNQVLLEHSSISPVLCCPCPNVFATCCRHQIQNYRLFTKCLTDWTWHILSL